MCNKTALGKPWAVFLMVLEFAKIFNFGGQMFDDKFFEDWLDNQAQKVMEKVANGEGVAPEQMMILMLKAQTNHFAHLDVDLRNEMVLLREDMDKRFEQVDKRFEQLTSRIDHFMIWSFATTVSVGGIVVAVIKFL